MRLCPVVAAMNTEFVSRKDRMLPVGVSLRESLKAMAAASCHRVDGHPT